MCQILTGFYLNNIRIILYAENLPEAVIAISSQTGSSSIHYPKATRTFVLNGPARIVTCFDEQEKWRTIEMSEESETNKKTCPGS
jgi:hypothetical protein